MATSDVDAIADWWRIWPEANIGLALGPGSGAIALDIDMKGGQDGLRSYRAITQDCYTGPVQQTPTGGQHLLFRPIEGLVNFAHRGHLGGLDMRTEGGYIVAAPSVTQDGHYRWIQDGPIPAMPDALRVACQQWSTQSNTCTVDVPDIPADLPDYHHLSPPLPPQYIDYLDHGETAPWDHDESRAIFAVAGALARRFPDRGVVMGILAANPYAWACAQRHRQVGDPAQWLWKYGVGKMVQHVEVSRAPATDVFSRVDHGGVSANMSTAGAAHQQSPGGVVPFPSPPDSPSPQDDRPRLTAVPPSLNVPVRPPQHVIDPLLPRGVVTLLGGHGGAGKSQLALVLAAHAACGRAWGGFAVAPCKSLYVSHEDPVDLARLRLQKIVREYDLPADQVEAGVRLVDATEAVLATEFVEAGLRRLVLTPAYEDLRALVAEHKPGLIFVDNASDAYDGPENDRRMVRGFVRALARIARDNDAAMVLLAHVDKVAARYGGAGNSYSGSTAWHNSARSRIALIEVEGEIQLHHEKANFTQRATPIPLDWSADGVLVPASKEAGRTAQDVEDDKGVLQALREAVAAGEAPPATRTGGRTAFHVLSCYPSFPEDLASAGKTDGRRRFWAAMDRLTDAGRICIEEYVNDWRKVRSRYVPVDSDPGPTPQAPPSETSPSGPEISENNENIENNEELPPWLL